MKIQAHVREFRSAIGFLMLASAFAFGVFDDARSALTTSTGSGNGDPSLVVWVIGCGLLAAAFFAGAVRAKDVRP